MGAEELKKKHEKKSQSGLMFMLLLGFLAAMMGFGYAWYHTETGMEQAEQFGLELSALALLYDRFASVAFIFPVAVWGAALIVTKAGKAQRNIGTMLAMLLFVYSVLWPAGALVAFMDAFDPPRTNRGPSVQVVPESQP